MNNAISTPNAPAAIGPYSQGIQAGSTLFVSGQLPIDPATGAFAGEDIASQTRQSLTNIKNILARRRRVHERCGQDHRHAEKHR